MSLSLSVRSAAAAVQTAFYDRVVISHKLTVRRAVVRLFITNLQVLLLCFSTSWENEILDTKGIGKRQG